MHEPPANVTPGQLRACLHQQYGLAASEIEFLPLGHDPAAWVYRVQAADGRAFFLKVRLRVTNEAGLRVPRFIQHHGQDEGIRRVVAPLPTVTGTLWAHTNGYALVLYPFIAGTNGMQQRLTDAQWIEYGRLVRQVHETPITPELAALVTRETFSPFGAAQIRHLDVHIGGRRFGDPAHHALAVFWQAQRDLIHTLVERAEALGRQVAATEPPLVLCHADIHTGNVLLDSEGRLWIVDWDETLLAPRERDLMFVIGGISRALVAPHEEQRFIQGYGQGYGADDADAHVRVAVDPLALAYYRYAWAVADIWAYGETVFRRPDLSPQLRLSECEMFRSLFAPGNIVSIALASDASRFSQDL